MDEKNDRSKTNKNLDLKIWEAGQLILGDIWVACHLSKNLPKKSENLTVEEYWQDDSSSSNDSEDSLPFHEAANYYKNPK